MRQYRMLVRSVSSLALFTTVMPFGAFAQEPYCIPGAYPEEEMCNVKLSDLGAPENLRFSAISRDGSIAAGRFFDDSENAFLGAVWGIDNRLQLSFDTLRSDGSGNVSVGAISDDGRFVLATTPTDHSIQRAALFSVEDRTLRSLGSLNSNDDSNSWTVAISGDGTTVIGQSETDEPDTVSNRDFVRRGFLWQDDGTGMRDLGSLRGNNTGRSTVAAVNHDGSVIVGSAETDAGPFAPFRAFRWLDDALGMREIPGSLQSDNGGSTSGRAVSDDGSVIVGLSDVDDGVHRRVFRWTEESGEMQDLGSLRDDNQGRANLGSLFATTTSTPLSRAVSRDGAVIVGSAETEDGTLRAFRWTAEANIMENLGSFHDDNPNTSYATAVSANGDVIVGAARNDDNIRRAFRWLDHETGMEELGSLKTDGTGFSEALAVSDDGSVIMGVAEVDAGGSSTFIWRSGAMVNHVNTAQSAVLAAETLAASATEFTQAVHGQLGMEVDVMEPGAAGGGDVTLSSQGQLGAAAAPRPRMALRLGGSLQHNSDIATAAGADIALAYGLGQGYTLGGFLELSRETDSKSAVSLRGTQLSGGAWLRFRENPDYTGLTWRVAASAGSGRFDVTREAILPGTVQGEGRSRVSTAGLSAELGYGVPLQNGVAVPFARLAAARTTRAAYTEDAAAVFPLSFDRHRDSSVVATLGVDGQFALAQRTSLTAGLGVSHDLHRSENPVTGTSAIPGLATFSVAGPSVVNSTRGYVTTGVTHGLGDGAAIRASATLAQSAWNNSVSMSARLGYEMRF